MKCGPNVGHALLERILSHPGNRKIRFAGGGALRRLSATTNFIHRNTSLHADLQVGCSTFSDNFGRMFGHDGFQVKCKNKKSPGRKIHF